jgi:hypothetical protein
LAACVRGILQLLASPAVAGLLFDLQLLDDGCQLGQNLVCLLVVLELGGDEFSEVAERLGGVEDLLFG